MNPSEVRVSLYDRLAMLITEDTKKSIRREAINVQFIPLVYLPTTPNLMLVACCACLCATSTTCLETQSKPNFSRNHLYRKASNTEAATRFINQHCTLCQT